MEILMASSNFNWKAIMLGSENWDFPLEIVFRTTIMFIVAFASLRLMGKRGVKQLSIFELVVIICLGSAAGDPMFYKEVGILPAVLVFVVIVGLYRLITFFIGKNKRFENLVEGKPVCLIKDGAFSIRNFSKESLGEDEFFAELRLQGVSQLGQIEEAIEESSGHISIFYYPDEEVKYGLSTMIGSLDTWQYEIKDSDYYACIFCGYTEKLEPAKNVTCPICQKNRWAKASNKKRVS